MRLGDGVCGRCNSCPVFGTNCSAASDIVATSRGAGRQERVTVIELLVLGVALGFLGTGTVTLLTVISAATVVVVIAGLYVGYHMGYEQKTKAYAIGGALLLLGAVDTVFRYVMV